MTPRNWDMRTFEYQDHQAQSLMSSHENWTFLTTRLVHFYKILVRLASLLLTDLVVDINIASVNDVKVRSRCIASSNEMERVEPP